MQSLGQGFTCTGLIEGCSQETGMRGARSREELSKGGVLARASLSLSPQGALGHEVHGSVVPP